MPCACLLLTRYCHSTITYIAGPSGALLLVSPYDNTSSSSSESSSSGSSSSSSDGEDMDVDIHGSSFTMHAGGVHGARGLMVEDEWEGAAGAQPAAPQFRKLGSLKPLRASNMAGERGGV